MARLRRLTLQTNASRRRWVLIGEGNRRVLRSFARKSDAMASAVLRRAAGRRGASISIRKQNGRFQEGRTIPRSLDSKRSKG